MESLFDYSLLFSLSGEMISLLTFVVQVICLLLMLRFFGVYGVFVYMSIAVVLGNVQVMKVGSFDLYPEGFALGTVTFASLFLCSDVLNEYYGQAMAKKAVYLTFIAMILTFIFMFLTLGHKPVSADLGHEAIKHIFAPAPRLFSASLIAYFSSQMIDVTIYSTLKKMAPKRFIWLRALCSLTVCAFCDNFIFSVFAWRILSPEAVSYDTLIYTYVIGGYSIRFVCAILGIPVLYMAKHFLPKKD